jgi:tyrosine-protein phosphatase YwqE
MIDLHAHILPGIDDGPTTSEVGWALSINRENASRGTARGKKALDDYEDLKDIGN